MNIINPVLTFYYHMFGSDMGSLHIDVWDGDWHNDEYTISSMQRHAQHKPYYQVSVDLSDYSDIFEKKILIRGIVGSGERSDLAIDKISNNELNLNTSGFPPPGGADNLIRPGETSQDQGVQIVSSQHRITICSIADKVVMNFTGDISARAHLFITDIAGRLIEDRDIYMEGTVGVAVNEEPGIYVVSLVSNETMINKKLLITH